jgi:hypothetical protein
MIRWEFPNRFIRFEPRDRPMVNQRLSIDVIPGPR